MNAQAFCNPSGDVIIYSNYDGGILNINVDQNIPNLKIGIVSYEAVKVQISGTYAGNVTEVRYAGYNGNNDNCSQGVTNTSITGVPNNIDTIILYPPAGYSNAFGYSSIICNYSCNNTSSQGGCNTPDQIVHYFMNVFGGTYYYHYTQYNCWQSSTTYNVSTGGNCCIVPTTLGLNHPLVKKDMQFYPNPAAGLLNVKFTNKNYEHRVDLYNLLGEKVRSVSFAADAEKGKLSLEGISAGIYFATLTEGGESSTEKIVVE